MLLLVSVTASSATATVLFQDNFDNVAVGETPSAQVGSWALDDAWAQASETPDVGVAMNAEFYIYVNDVTDSLPQLGLWGAGGDALAWPDSYGILISLFNGGDFAPYAVTNYDGTAHVETGLTFTPDVWEKWAIDYVVVESSYNLTVGSNSTTSLTKASDSLLFQTNNRERLPPIFRR